MVRPLEADLTLEIGPGRGSLTASLLAFIESLVAIEIDRDLAAFLRRRFAETGLRLIEGDILQLDLRQILRQGNKEKLFIVGNLPYNITAPLLFRLLEQAPCIRYAVLMLQWEVARRLVARPGSKDYGLLSVLLAMRANARMCLEVSPQAFRPIPKVQSALVELRFRDACRYPVQDERMFAKLVRAAFGQRRKMMHNSLGNLQQRSRKQLEEIAALADIDLRRRPETLTVEEFGRLSDAFTAVGKEGSAAVNQHG
jgi:16S rRNA (adenine1518-N6/adenine1519-N6)-dimethyltransferase